MQQGQIIRRGHSWLLRYWRTTDAGRTRKCEKVADVNDQYRVKNQVRDHPRVQQLLGAANEGKVAPGIPTFKEYVEKEYLPYAKENKRPSTYKGYKNLYYGMIAPHLNGTLLIEFGNAAVPQRLLDKLAEPGTLTTTTLIHAKSFLSGVISHAIRYDKMAGVQYNPLHRKLVVVEGGVESEKTASYDLGEVEDILDSVGDNQLYRTLIAVAAYSGLRRGEIRGLQWGDIQYDSKLKVETISINRTFWEGSEAETKTAASVATIPLIEEAGEELEAYRKLRGDLASATSYIFEGPRPNVPYDISAIGNKRIKTNCPQLWRGWHAFRRGLGDTLLGVGVEMKTIADILRHKTPVTSNIVTERYYTKESLERMIPAMRKVSQEVKNVRSKRDKSA